LALIPDSIGDLETLGQPMPIGIANCVGRNAARPALWRLTVGKVDLPGQFASVRLLDPNKGCGHLLNRLTQSHSRQVLVER
jgi:hypothetical protein